MTTQRLMEAQSDLGLYNLHSSCWTHCTKSSRSHFIIRESFCYWLLHSFNPLLFLFSDSAVKLKQLTFLHYRSPCKGQLSSMFSLYIHFTHKGDSSWKTCLPGRCRVFSVKNHLIEKSIFFPLTFHIAYDFVYLSWAKINIHIFLTRI